MVPKQGFDLRVHQLLNQTIAFAALLEPDGTVKDVSDNALSAAGLSLEDVHGSPFWEGYWFAYDAALQERLRLAIQAASAGATSRFDYAARIVDDGRLHIDFQIAPIRDADGKIVELLASGFDVTEREQSKARLELALRDADHRIKNIFTTVRAMARMTKHFAPPETAFDEFLARFEALVAAHRVLSSTSHSGYTTFRELADAILKPYVQDAAADRCTIIGGDRMLVRDKAKLLALCLHELATNAAKYGALSAVGGKITLSLSDPDVDGSIAFIWEENFDTPVPSPTKIGFGTKFLEMSLHDIFDDPPKLERGSRKLTLTASGRPTDLYENLNDFHPPRPQPAHPRHRG
ncbi:sensor histidine kinase [Salipiger sp. PrR003]|uniref:sensor histidine kinase n=1 Tax=Salipiger sp. PrR003 TaxID=2706776 RepID=UPI0013D95EBA|nr:HWE histidine kinase domain-containing protein [Salipiger sp. PrR003]NDV53041.1 PAS domain-containing protein [Salipiger sp. PrR003]